MVEAPGGLPAVGAGWFGVNKILRLLDELIIFKKIKHIYLSSIGMDIIDITSSDSENETEAGSGSHLKSLSDAGLGIRNFRDPSHDLDVGRRQSTSSDGEKLSTSYSPVDRRIHLMGMSDAKSGSSLENYGRDKTTVEYHNGSFPRPRCYEHGDLISMSDSDWGNDVKLVPASTQKRALPFSFLRNDSSTHSKPGVPSCNIPALPPYPETHVHVGHPSTIELDLDDGAGKTIQTDSRQGLGSSNYIPTHLQTNSSTSSSSNHAPLNQHTDKRTLPRSLQPNWSKTTSQASQMKTTNHFHDFPGRPDGSVVASTSHKDGGEANLVDSDDDELYMFDGSGLPALYIGKNITSSHSTHPMDNGKQVRAMGTSMAVEPITQDHNKAPQRLLPSWMSGKSFPDRHPASFQPVDLSGSREYPRVGEQAHAQHDERLIYEVALQDLAQPKFEVDLPSGLLSVSLLRHQKIALAWLDQKEMSGLPCSGGILADDQGLGKTVSMIALIQKQMPLQKKFMSNQSSKIISETLNLDEDDKATPETGKTLCIGENDHPKSSSSRSTLMPMSIKGRPAAGTLVVCPASVLRQWAHELDEKVTNSAKLSVLVYHGGTRTKSPHDLAKYDVVLTTYAIVTNEVPKKPLAGDDDGERRNSEEYVLSSEFSTDKKRKAASSSSNKKKKKGKGSLLDLGGGPLAGVRWFRVILDEAQIIKNHRTQVARACCGLRAKRRWCLSGTPIQNAIDDIYSYFRFLKYEPYAVFSSFCSSIKAPILRNADNGYKKLQAILKTVMLRRTKGTIIDGKPILNLPPKSISLKKLTFSYEERTFYTELEANFRERFKTFAAEGTLKQNYASILLMLLRLRQACDHPLLVKDYHINSSSKTSVGTAKKLPKEMLLRLLNQLEVLPLCGLCNDPPEDAVITMCGHVFCYQCVSESLGNDETLCPASGCRSTLGEDSIFSKGTLKSCMPNSHELAVIPSTFGAAEDFAQWQDGYTSSKILAAVEILKSIRDSSTMFLEASSEGHDYIISSREKIHKSTSDNSNDMFSTYACTSLQHKLLSKAIVFSQWTSMLDLIEDPLNYSEIQYRRLDGTMSLASREKAVQDFYSDPEVTVMLMSLKAGNLGLNMIAACHVILLDLWWNPTSEDQAIDRAHRIGQTKSVTVHRLTIEDTVEERILRLQEKKREMVSSAFGEDPSGRPGTRLTVEDLRYLFQV